MGSRLTRSEKKAQTREALLRSAMRAFARRGYHGASVDDIAEDAGFSVGALYSNFSGKEELLLATIERNVDDWAARLARDFGDAETIDDQIRAPADGWIAALDEDSDPFLFWIELWAYAVRNPELRPELAARSLGARALFDDMARAVAARAGVEFDDEEAERLGAVIDALGIGFAIRHALDPEAAPAALFGDSLVPIVRALLAEKAAEGDDASRPPSDDARR